MSIALKYKASMRPKTVSKFTAKSTDDELIAGCIAGNRLAQHYLYQRYYGKMMGICMRYTGNRTEAKEILNFAFLKVFKSLGHYKAEGSFSGWVAKIVFRTTIDHVRSTTSYKKKMDFNLSSAQTVTNTAIDHLATEELFALIQKLPTASRTVFCLYAIDGYKHKEIAKQLNISEGTSKWHLAAARKTLQTLLLNLSKRD